MYLKKHLINMKPRGLRTIRGYSEVNEKSDQLETKLKRKVYEIEHEACNKRDKTHEESPTRELSPELIEPIKKLNDRFRELNQIIRDEYRQVYEEGRKRVLDKNDWVMDFEIALIITYSLEKNDPDYDENDDNIIGGFEDDLGYCHSGKLSYQELTDRDYKRNVLKDLDRDWVIEIEPEKRCHSNWQFSEAFDHITLPRTEEGSEYGNFRHTYLLHDLYEHQALDFKDIARMKDIDMKMKIIYQNWDGKF